ncbi:MAG: KilA-N domain-containing protein [Polyangiaceae bacterium]|nr:KilA-N domain-containing protein [Polyangiaceae bacterium]
MSKAKTSTMEVQGTAIAVLSDRSDDYICLTDIARHKNADGMDDLIRNWLRNRNTVEFLGVWERLNNANFNPVEFDGIRMQAGLNSFTLTAKQWIEKTGAIGIVSNPQMQILTASESRLLAALREGLA